MAKQENTSGDRQAAVVEGQSAVERAGYIDRLSELKPFPAAAVRLIEAVGDDSVEIEEVSRLVSEDPALVAEVLNRANASTRARVSQVTTLDGAIMAVGQKGIAEIAITVLCGRYLMEEVALPEVARSLWMHSLAVGAMATVLAPRLDGRPDVAKTIGLLHEIGRIVLLRIEPDAVQAIDDAITRGIPMAEAEQDVLGFGAGELTPLVARAVGLPASIVGLLDELAGRKPATSPETQAVVSAENMAPLFGYPVYASALGSVGEEQVAPLLDEVDDLARELSNAADEAAHATYSDAEHGVGIVSVSPERAFDALLSLNRRLARLNTDYEQAREEVERRAEETRNLADTLAAVTMGLEQGALRYSILESLLENFSVDASFLVNAGESEGRLEGVLFTLAEGGADFAPLAIDMALIDRETRQSLMRGLSLGLAGREEDPYLFETVGTSYGAIRVAPLMVRGACQGMLGMAVIDKEMPGGHHTNFLEIIAGAAALGLENARLYQNALQDVAEDALTGVASRRAIIERLEQSCQNSAARTAVLLVDLDHFKAVNDTLGHQQGDRYLKDIAKAMRTVLPPEAAIGRYGGDEFLVMLDVESAAEAQVVAERLRTKIERIARSTRWKDVKAPLGASIGLAFCEGTGSAPEELIEGADASLYRAKKDGRNRVGEPTLTQPVA